MIVNARNSHNVYQNGTTIHRGEDIQLAQNLTKTVQLLATSNCVLAQVLAADKYSGISLEELKQRIYVSGEDGTAFLWLTLSWEDSQQAIDLLNYLIDVLPKVMIEVKDIGAVCVIDTTGQVIGASLAFFNTYLLE